MIKIVGYEIERLRERRSCYNTVTSNTVKSKMLVPDTIRR